MANPPNVPPSVEYGFRQEWSSADSYQKYNAPRHQQYVYHLVDNKFLTSDGVAWSTVGGNNTCDTGSSKSSMIITGYASTMSWPGLQGFYIQELECGLTVGVMGGGDTASTARFRWEIKNSTGSTWQAISTYKGLASGSSTKTEYTVSGYGKLGLGYNRLPLGIRLRGYRRSDVGSSEINFYVKNSSYVAIKAKKSS